MIRLKMVKIQLNSIFKEIFKDYSIIILLYSVIGLAVNMNDLFCSILLFSSFDYLVFQRIVKSDIELKGLVPYRVVQTILQYLLVYYIYINNGLDDSIWFMLMWWFGVCDLLYYLVGKESIKTYNDMFWLWWTPAGIVCKILGKKINYKYLYYQVATIIILYLNHILLN